MNRRRFLGVLAAAAASLALAPTALLDTERELWQPGKVKTFDLGALPQFGMRVEDADLGVSIRFVRQFDASGMFNPRLDLLYGWWGTVRPDLACRVLA